MREPFKILSPFGLISQPKILMNFQRFLIVCFSNTWKLSIMKILKLVKECLTWFKPIQCLLKRWCVLLKPWIFYSVDSFYLIFQTFNKTRTKVAKVMIRSQNLKVKKSSNSPCIQVILCDLKICTLF